MENKGGAGCNDGFGPSNGVSRFDRLIQTQPINRMQLYEYLSFAFGVCRPPA